MLGFGLPAAQLVWKPQADQADVIDGPMRPATTQETYPWSYSRPLPTRDSTLLMLGTLGPVNIEPACRGLFVVQRVSDVAHAAQRDKDVALRQKRERQDC